jgi:inner membrane protein
LEPLTHFLTGACLGRAGFNRKTALATTTMVLAAEAPDIDVVGYVRGSVFGFAHHRGITHSFIGVPLVAALVLGVVYLLYRFKYRGGRRHTLPQPRWGLLYWFGCLAALSHILLDFTNNYGVRPFTPFYPHWYSWDIVFILEPTLMLCLIAGLTVPWLFGLVHEEIGVKRRGPRGQLGAILALIGVVAVWMVRDFEHRRAVAALEARVYEGVDPIRVSAFPYWADPFKWMGVVETENFFQSMHVNSLGPEVDPDNQAQIRYKPEETPVTLAAKGTYLGRVYLDWAQYPITETERLVSPPGGYIVRFHDLRFMYPERKSRPLTSAVILDRNLNVVAERMGARGQPRTTDGTAGSK